MRYRKASTRIKVVETLSMAEIFNQPFKIIEYLVKI